MQSINPYTLQTIATYKELTDKAITQKLALSEKTYQHWRNTSFQKRSDLMRKVAQLLRSEPEKYAQTMTVEMGKPISQAIAEIQKCAWVCDYYANHAEPCLAHKVIKTDASESFVRYDSLGTILAIMPWNYPFWQFFRFAAPNLMAGNVGLLKHASNVFGCAQQMEQLFLEAGFPKGVFQNLLISSKKVAPIIADRRVKGVTLTGSEKAGSSVAQTAGKHIKKTVLELGGSNAFIVLKDANIKQAAATGVSARLQNAGQSCIAAKRFILLEAIADNFLDQFTKAFKAIKVADPIKEATKMGPMARVDLAEKLEEQLQQSVAKGAKILVGGKREKACFEPTILTHVKKGMSAFHEELFGPVASVFIVKTEQAAIDLANDTNFGLGDTIFSQDIEKAKQLAGQLEGGAVFINELVKSDPRLPFGGTKISGYGRELSEDGILEFVNKKTVYVK